MALYIILGLSVGCNVALIYGFFRIEKAFVGLLKDFEEIHDKYLDMAEEELKKSIEDYKYEHGMK